MALSLGEMLFRLVMAILLGAFVGLEREIVGKEAGVRTNLLVAGGATMFTLVGLSLPFIVAQGNLGDVLARNSGFLSVIANIVIGVGFLGAGAIIHDGSRVRGLTTAASVWLVAAIGVLCGIGLIMFAAISTFGITALLIILRKVDLYGLVGKESASNKKHNRKNGNIVETR